MNTEKPVVVVRRQIVSPASTEAMQVRQAKVKGIDMPYVEEGIGETVVFVHGALGDWRTREAVRPYVSPKYLYVSLSRR